MTTFAKIVDGLIVSVVTSNLDVGLTADEFMVDYAEVPDGTPLWSRDNGDGSFDPPVERRWARMDGDRVAEIIVALAPPAYLVSPAIAATLVPAAADVAEGWRLVEGEWSNAWIFVAGEWLERASHGHNLAVQSFIAQRDARIKACDAVVLRDLRQVAQGGPRTLRVIPEDQVDQPAALHAYLEALAEMSHQEGFDPAAPEWPPAPAFL